MLESHWTGLLIGLGNGNLKSRASDSDRLSMCPSLRLTSSFDPSLYGVLCPSKTISSSRPTARIGLPEQVHHHRPFGSRHCNCNQ